MVSLDLHEEPSSGNYVGNTTMHKIMQFGFY